MTTVISQVQNKNIVRDAEFLKITVPTAPGNPFLFSNSYRRETISGGVYAGTYTNLGGLLSVSGNQRDLSVTSFDTAITLVGVDKTKIGQIIDAGLKGASIQMWRGFYNSNYELDGNFVLRYTGIITNFDIHEERIESIDAFTLNLHCSSFKRVLESRINGRYTNASSWRNVTAQDASMDNVAVLKDAKFSFGVKLA